MFANNQQQHRRPQHQLNRRPPASTAYPRNRSSAAAPFNSSMRRRRASPPTFAVDGRLRRVACGGFLLLLMSAAAPTGLVDGAPSDNNFAPTSAAAATTFGMPGGGSGVILFTENVAVPSTTSTSTDSDEDDDDHPLNARQPHQASIGRDFNPMLVGEQLVLTEKVMAFDSESTAVPLNELAGREAFDIGKQRPADVRRIKIAEIITDEFQNAIGQRQRSPPATGDSGRDKLTDLYPSKLEDFRPIIRQSNERLINEKHVFVQDFGEDEDPADTLAVRDGDVLLRGRVVLNEPNALPFGGQVTLPADTKIEIELIDDVDEPLPNGDASNGNNGGVSSKVSEFTRELLRDNDGIINTIEQRFVNVARHPSPEAEQQQTRRNAHGAVFEARVKKFDSGAHINTERHSSDATAAEADKPDYSTTKFYNSKELYGAMQQQSSRTSSSGDGGVDEQSSTVSAPAAPVTNSGSDEISIETPPAPSPSSSSLTPDQSSKPVSSSTENAAKINTPKDGGKLRKLVAKVMDHNRNGKKPTNVNKPAPNGNVPSAVKPSTVMSMKSRPAADGAVERRMSTVKFPASSDVDEEAVKIDVSSPSSVSSSTTMSSTSTTNEATTKLIAEAPTTASITATSPSTTSSTTASGSSYTSTAATTAKTTAASVATDDVVATTSTAVHSESEIRTALRSPPSLFADGRQPLTAFGRLQERLNVLDCELPGGGVAERDLDVWRGNETHELSLPNTIPENCSGGEDVACAPMVISWEGSTEIQSGDVLIVEIDDTLLLPEPNSNASAGDGDSSGKITAHKVNTAVYQVTRPGHEHCDVTEGVLLDITPLQVDGKKLVTLYDKDLTEGDNLLIVVSELWGQQCVRLKVTVKADNCGEGADCSSKGVCYSNASMEGYECQCCTGFAGSHCEEIDACTPSPCTNNGICVDLSQGHEGNAYQCLCPYGYAGKNCQYEIDPCNPSECQNGGSCNGNATHFRCDCAPGYSGPLCQHNHNDCESSPCVHGICVDQENGFRCFCQPGFAGELCSFEYNECESNPCLNGGQCADHIGGFACKCTPGYTGKRCHIKVDFCANNPCPEGHRCNDRGDDYACECPGGRNGPDCNQVPRTLCNVNPCANGGTCWTSEESFYCACRPGYTGKMCEDEFIVETVISSNEMLSDDQLLARPFGDSSYSAVISQSNGNERFGGLHNAYVAVGTFATAILLVVAVVAGCHCRVNVPNYRRFAAAASRRSAQLLPTFGKRRAAGLGRHGQPLKRHWLTGRRADRIGLSVGAAGSAIGSRRSATGAPVPTHLLQKSAACAQAFNAAAANNVSGTPKMMPLFQQQHSGAFTPGRPMMLNRHLAMTFDQQDAQQQQVQPANGACEYGESKQTAPLIQ